MFLFYGNNDPLNIVSIVQVQKHEAFDKYYVRFKVNTVEVIDWEAPDEAKRDKLYDNVLSKINLLEVLDV